MMLVLCELQHKGEKKKKGFQSLFFSKLSAVLYYISFHSSVAICIFPNPKWRSRTNDPKNRGGKDPATLRTSLFILFKYVLGEELAGNSFKVCLFCL